MRGGDQEGQASVGCQEAGGCREDFEEALDGSEGYYVEGGRGKGLGAGVLYIDVRQCKGAGQFAEEGCFLLIRFDQGEGDVGGPDFYGTPGKPAPEPRSATRASAFGLRASVTWSASRAISLQRVREVRGGKHEEINSGRRIGIRRSGGSRSLLRCGLR